MPRYLWTGTVSFALVAIPVGLTSCLRSSKVSFNLLHDKDHARLSRRLYCPADNTFVHPEHVVRGAPVDGDQYVVVRDQEIESLAPQRSKTIEISEFCDPQSISELYYDRPYYLLPRPGGEKPYALLTKTLAGTNKAGISMFVLHERQHLVAIRSIDRALTLFMLHWPAELLDDKELLPAKAKADKKLVAKMEKLIEEMSAPFDPKKHQDPYRQKLKQMPEEKQRRGQIVEVPAQQFEQQQEESFDLIEALQQSMAQSRSDRDNQ